MEVKPGYKQTEAGVISEDWDVQQFTQVTALITCGIAATPNYVSESEGYPFLSSTNVKDGRIVWAGYKHISAGLHRQLYRNNPPKRGDILYSRVGSFGEAAVVDVDFEFSVYVSLTLIKPGKSLDSSFLMQLLNSEPYKKRAKEQIYLGGGVGNLNVDVVRRYPIVLPPLPEQRAIAGALSDVDALIGALDQLIAKKRDLKQAAMQQLLTGQKRLPGFHGEWEVKTLGDLFAFSGGYSASRDQLSSEGHCYLHYGDIHKSSKTFIDARSEYLDIPKLDIPLNRVSPLSLLDDGDVVFVDASEDDEGTSRHVVIVNKDKTPFISGLHTIVAKSKTNELDHQYKRFCFQTAAIKRQFYFYAVGTKVSGISKTNITKLTLPVPSLPEQTAIAEALSDMDAELVALEQRRDKTRALKQGMMQELLTGRTRLIN